MPVAGDSVLWARRAFFALASVTALRFLAKGWVREFYTLPSYHFTWPGFHFAIPLPHQGLVLVFVAMAISAACAALERWVFASALSFTLLFVYVELLDRTYYLNHYYLITLVAMLFTATTSVVRITGGRARVPRWLPLLLRTQVGLVYVYAGIAKLNMDFLFRGEPLHTWLLHHGDVPLIGPMLILPITAIAMSWAGTLFDLLVVPTLLLSATRSYAYAMVVCFHLITFTLLGIGVFPWFMMALATLYFTYDWPVRLFKRNQQSSLHVSTQTTSPLGAGLAVILCSYLLIQVMLPLRHLAYPGSVNWSEEGFRFAWRVMLFEKTGRVEYRVEDAASGRVSHKSPHAELTPMQASFLSTQPDMIRQYATHLAQHARDIEGREVHVFADTAISLNGRHAVALLDPTCDLAMPLSPLSHDPCILPQDLGDE